MGSKGITGEGRLGCAARCEAESCNRSSHAVLFVVGTMVLNRKKRHCQMWNNSFRKQTQLILLMCLSLLNEYYKSISIQQKKIFSLFHRG